MIVMVFVTAQQIIAYQINEVYLTTRQHCAAAVYDKKFTGKPHFTSSGSSRCHTVVAGRPRAIAKYMIKF